MPPPAHVEGPAPEWFSWELGRFCELALKANPNLLEVLAFDRTSPVIEQSRMFDIMVVGDELPGGNWDHGLVDVPTQWSAG